MEAFLSQRLTEILLATGGVFATNLENVLLLVGVYCRKSHNAGAVRLGFALGSLVLLLLSLSVLLIADLLPLEALGYLGLIPLALGCKELYQRWRSPQANDEVQVDPRAATPRLVFSATLLMVASGGDTVAVFAPLFAETQHLGVAVMALSFLVSSLLLAFLAGRLCTHPRLSAPFKRYGSRFSPLIMILIGIYILLNTGTDLLPG